MTVIALIIRTSQRKTYKRLKKPAQTTGIVDKIHPETSVVDYSYTDNHGKRHTASFRLLGKHFKKGDKIEICFDAENPEKSIPGCTLKSWKTFWSEFLFYMVVVIAVFVILNAFSDYSGLGEKLRIWRKHRRHFR